jgi:type I restriction enzyme, R subunit
MRLVELVRNLDEEQEQTACENLSDKALAVFDLLKRDALTTADRERGKQASQVKLNQIKARLAELARFRAQEQSKGVVEVVILDEIFTKLPSPLFTTEAKELVAGNAYAHLWQQAMSGGYSRAAQGV